VVKIYLDLETYRPNDAFLDEKIIALGMLIEFGYSYSTVPKDEVIEYKWGDPIPSSGIWKYIETDENTTEEEIISRFYQLLEKFDDIKIIIGFNILRFDIPLLVQRGKELGVKDVKDANLLFYDTFTVDYFQVCLTLNNMRFKGNRLENCASKLEQISGQQIPKRVGRGSDIVQLYEQKNYDEIKDHLYSDLLVIRAIDLIFVDKCWEAFRQEQKKP
jgi:DNA polymerase elongation subunit (family B)